jgi:AcrR family transcriptional regulator
MEDVLIHPSDVKERIIRATVSLIENSDGFVENITLRAIAQEADVAVGLINYHFGTKQNLIEICVQRIISHVMETFSQSDTSKDGNASGKNKKSDIASFTGSVFTFLIHHPQIAKISILSDLAHPNAQSNSSVSHRAIFKAMSNEEPEEIRKMKAFLLLSTIQSAFLNRQISSELLGMDLNVKEDYCRFFRLITEILGVT